MGEQLTKRQDRQVENANTERWRLGLGAAQPQGWGRRRCPRQQGCGDRTNPQAAGSKAGLSRRSHAVSSAVTQVSRDTTTALREVPSSPTQEGKAGQALGHHCLLPRERGQPAGSAHSLPGPRPAELGEAGSLPCPPRWGLWAAVTEPHWAVYCFASAEGTARTGGAVPSQPGGRARPWEQLPASRPGRLPPSAGATINNTFYLQVLELSGEDGTVQRGVVRPATEEPGSPRGVGAGSLGGRSAGLQRLRTGSEVRLWAHGRGAGRQEGVWGGSRSTQVRGRGQEVQGTRVRHIPTVWEAGLCTGSALTAGGGAGGPGRLRLPSAARCGRPSEVGLVPGRVV